MFNGRMYIVSSPALASQVQRASASLSFERLTVEVAPRLLGLGEKTKRILADTEVAAPSLNQIIQPLLGPAEMVEICRKQLEHFTAFFQAMTDDLETDLFKLVKQEMTEASMNTFFGPHNPFVVHPDLVNEFWNWENGIVPYAVGVLPQWTARRAYKGINRVADGFEEYLSKGRQSQACELIRRRQKLHDDTGLTYAEQARLEVGFSLGINVNASVTAFWVLNNIFSRPTLLAELREEIQRNAVLAPNTISFRALRDSCPLLNSIYRETMRFCAPMSTTRYVLEDTVIADSYFLRKDSIVQIIGGLLHADEALWGPDVDKFNSRRFIYTPNGSKTSEDGAVLASKEGQLHPAAFRAFGGGTSLCPGRHFAQMEILSFTAAFVMGFDMSPPTGLTKVAWDPPMAEKTFLIAAIKPHKELNVKVSRRQGMEDLQWLLQY
jgi:cytochrome P450